jgi:hypothetical protein
MRQSNMATKRINILVLAAGLLFLTYAPSALASRHLYQAPNDQLTPPAPGTATANAGTASGPSANAAVTAPAASPAAALPAPEASPAAAGAASPPPTPAAGGAGNAAGAPPLPALGGGMMMGNNTNITETAANITQTLGLNGTNATSLERCIALLDSYNITLVNGTTGEPLTGANATSMVGATCVLVHVMLSYLHREGDCTPGRVHCTLYTSMLLR